MIDPQYRYALYSHVGRRLQQRCDIPRRNFNLALWEKISYACARRQFPVLKRDRLAVFLQGDFFGAELIWVYGRDRRAVTTVYPPNFDLLKLHYEEVMRSERY